MATIALEFFFFPVGFAACLPDGADCFLRGAGFSPLVSNFPLMMIAPYYNTETVAIFLLYINYYTDCGIGKAMPIVLQGN
ncbi:MAG: hypothetical protein PHS97_06470 [Oscillospiraceae bacterium]|nr:hypothetical protein [Oscillospiraceae bacterium]